MAPDQKTVVGAGLQASPQGGWVRCGSKSWADVSTSEIDSDSGDNSSRDEAELAKSHVDEPTDLTTPNGSEEESAHAIEELGRHIGVEKGIAYARDGGQARAQHENIQNLRAQISEAKG